MPGGTSCSGCGRRKNWVCRGIGIAPNDLERIFGIFVKVHAAESYAGSIVDSDLKDSRHIAMLAKLTADLAPLGVTAAELQAEMHRLDSIARSQIMGEAGSGRHTVSPS